MEEAIDPVESHDGGCLCGQVRYRVRGPLRGVIFCHCEQCRRTSGHHVAMTSCPRPALDLINAEGLRWYQSSNAARRGFCQTCGGNLFWDPNAGDSISIAAGTLDVPTRVRGAEHIYVASKSDYYAITDDLPQQAEWS